MDELVAAVGSGKKKKKKKQGPSDCRNQRGTKEGTGCSVKKKKEGHRLLRVPSGEKNAEKERTPQGKAAYIGGKGLANQRGTGNKKGLFLFVSLGRSAKERGRGRRFRCFLEGEGGALTIREKKRGGPRKECT